MKISGHHAVILIATVMLASVAAQENRPQSSPPKAASPRFPDFDLDENGKIDRIEFGLSEVAQKVRDNGRPDLVARIFNDIDRNSDGAIDAEEFSRALAGTGTPSPADTPSESDTDPLETPELSEPITERFEELDRNRDDELSLREMARAPLMEKLSDRFGRDGAARFFERIDRDGDGAVSIREFALANQEMARVRQPNGKGPPMRKGKGPARGGKAGGR